MDSVVRLAKTAGYAYAGYDYTKSGIGNMDFNSNLSKDLYHRCCDIAEDLQQIEYRIVNTGRAKRLTDSIEDALELCKKYDKKNCIKKFISSSSDKSEFQMKHIIIHFHFSELCMSSFLTSEFSNED